MNAHEKQLKQKLIEKRKIVKQKLDLLKQGEIAHEDIFSPITKHLKNIETKLVKNKTPTTTTTKEIYEDGTTALENFPGTETTEPSQNITYTPLPLKRRRLQFRSTPLKEEEEEEENFNSDDEPGGIKKSIIEEASRLDNDLETVAQNQHEKTRHQNLMEESFQDYLQQYEPLPRKYIRDMITDTSNKFDHKYGIVFNAQSEKFHIGDSELKIIDSDIMVQGKRYKGTPGLYELLFKKYPDNFTAQDEKNYVDIILKTNAHRRYNKATEQVQGSTLPKYKKIIAPGIRHISGKGVGKHTKLFMQYSNKPIEYVHWDDPNELVDRLRLLVASQTAGNTSHTNEINSIIEELREANLIE